MVVSGIDIGGKNVHIIIKKDGKILGKIAGPAGIKKGETVDQLFNQALKQAGLTRKELGWVVTTGSSAKKVPFATGFVPDVTADAMGVHRLFTTGRTVIDVGAEECRVIKVAADGKVLDFVINEKCAAGTGTFVEAMARALEVSLDEMGKIAFQSDETISINAQCAVFGESEVVSLIHQKTSKPNIARAVMNAIAGRISSIARIVGLERDIVMIGGMAKNAGFVDSMKKELGMDIIIPEDPDFIGALGAAELALSNGMAGEIKRS